MFVKNVGSAVLQTFSGEMWSTTQNFDPIGSAVLTFIGYEQTDKQTNRQAKFIYRRWWESNSRLIISVEDIHICNICCYLAANCEFLKWKLFLLHGNFETSHLHEIVF